MKISLKYKAKLYEIEVNEDDTIEILKERLEKMTIDEFKITSKEMKFIANGRILKDEQTLKDANIVDKSQIFVSGTQQKPAAKEVSPAGLDINNTSNVNNYANAPPQNSGYNNNSHAYNNPIGNMDNQLLQNIMSQQLEQIQKDPSILDAQLEPLLRGMSEPEKQKWKDAFLEDMKMMKDNPDLMKSKVDQLSNMDPKTIQNMMSGVGLQPNAFPQNFGVPQNYNTMPQQPNMYQQNMQFPLQSPTIPCSHGYYPYGHQFQTPPPSQPVNLENVYKEQLQMLDDMNFKDRNVNLKALIQAKGDINMAIDFILDWTKK
ncbi:hypothetical protein BDAP_002345 [Binucleata daphniae]